jgi:hypothetical protein
MRLSEVVAWRRCSPSAETRLELRAWWSLVWKLSICSGAPPADLWVPPARSLAVVTELRPPSPACRMAMELTDSAVLGHLNTDYLAASALANVWMWMSACVLYAYAHEYMRARAGFELDLRLTRGAASFLTDLATGSARWAPRRGGPETTARLDCGCRRGFSGSFFFLYRL